MSEILKARLVGDPESRFSGVAVDSRETRPGQLFVALKGERTDGHQYLTGALRAGATVVMVSREPGGLPEGRAAVIVPDTLIGMGALARWYRKRHSVRVVGITGSVGKTTTKEMLARCLKGTSRLLVSPRNYNTEIGVPLALFGLTPSTQVAVLEMAMRGRGQIAYLGSIARHDTAIITNIGSSHMELLGSIEAIANSKAEVLEGTHLAVLNRDDAWIRRISEGFEGEIAWYGLQADADYRAVAVSSGHDQVEFRVVTPVGEAPVRLSFPGTHNVQNALAALAAAVSLGVPLEDAARRLEGMASPPMRMEVLESGAIKVINDAYNSSPASAGAALQTLSSMEGRRVAVLGDMLELGSYAEQGHREVGWAAARSGLSLLVAVGDLGRVMGIAALESGMERDRVVFCRDNREALDVLAGYLAPGDTVLVKGSRGMKMEEIVQALGGGMAK